MIQIIDIDNRELWDTIVGSFAEYDVYYLSGYVKGFEIHGDGTPQLLYYECSGLRAMYVYMRRPTSIDGLYDSITPYGYGGVLFEGDMAAANLEEFWRAYVAKMNELNIVDNFVRYHPVLANAEAMRSITEVVDLGKTIALDLHSPECIWQNITSKNRNMIRKAEKSGIRVGHSADSALFDDFVRIYNATMDRDNATAYYYFAPEFYRSIAEDLSGNYELFYAECDGQIIAMSIIIFANKQMHYHLSGSMAEYRSLAPTNLLLYKAALWGCEQGFASFHLGGGVGSGEDNLYKFKASFNRTSDYRFSIAKHIFDGSKYDSLVEMRAMQDPEFDRESHFFPLYRS